MRAASQTRGAQGLPPLSLPPLQDSRSLAPRISFQAMKTLACSTLNGTRGREEGVWFRQGLGKALEGKTRGPWKDQLCSPRGGAAGPGGEGVRRPSERWTDKGREDRNGSGPPSPAEFNIACCDGAPDSRLSPFCF